MPWLTKSDSIPKAVKREQRAYLPIVDRTNRCYAPLCVTCLLSLAIITWAFGYMLVHETPFIKSEPSRVPLPLYIYTQDIPPHTPFHAHIFIILVIRHYKPLPRLKTFTIQRSHAGTESLRDAPQSEQYWGLPRFTLLHDLHFQSIC